MTYRRLNARQLEILRWIVSGVDDKPPWDDATFLTTVGALDSRRLVTIFKKDGGFDHPKVTKAGRYYAEHEQFPDGHVDRDRPLRRNVPFNYSNMVEYLPTAQAIPATEAPSFTVAEGARRLGVKEYWYAEHLRGHSLPGHKIGRMWRLTESDIQAAFDVTYVATHLAADENGAHPRRMRSGTIPADSPDNSLPLRDEPDDAPPNHCTAGCTRPTHIAQPPEMSVQDVATRLDVSPDYVYSLLRTNKLAGIRVANKWRITEVDYQAYLDSNRSPMLREKNPFGLTPRSLRRLQRGQI